jgi:hypothetical protein
VQVHPNIIENEKLVEGNVEVALSFLNQQGGLFCQCPYDSIAHHCLLYISPSFVAPKCTMDMETGSASDIMVTE